MSDKNNCYQKGFEAAMKPTPSKGWEHSSQTSGCRSNQGSKQFESGYKAGVKEYQSKPQFNNNGFD